VRDPTLSTDFAKIDAALKLEQQMKDEGADHDHEAAVKSAAAILDLFPNHTTARAVLKESGLIYRSLQAAVTAMRDCFNGADSDGKPTLISVTMLMPTKRPDTKHKLGTEDTTSSIVRPDFPKIAYHLGKATEAVDRAVQLDPQFERAIAAKKLGENVQAFVGMQMTDWILRAVRAQLGSCQSEIDLADRWIDAGMKSRLPSPWKHWDKAKSYFGELAAVDEEYPIRRCSDRSVPESRS
jgi:hypothetical protein